VDEQRLARQPNQRQEQAGGEAQRAGWAPSSSTLAGRQLGLAKKTVIRGDGMRRQRGNQPRGDENANLAVPLATGQAFIVGCCM
jgi:hypothetical protein